MTKGRTGAAIGDCTEMFNESGAHIATIGFNESYGFWQIVIAQRKEMGFFCPSLRMSHSPPGTTNSIPNSRNRHLALASMLDLSVSSRTGSWCNFCIPDESNCQVKIYHVANI